MLTRVKHNFGIETLRYNPLDFDAVFISLIEQNLKHDVEF